MNSLSLLWYRLVVSVVERRACGNQPVLDASLMSTIECNPVFSLLQFTNSNRRRFVCVTWWSGAQQLASRRLAFFHVCLKRSKLPSFWIGVDGDASISFSKSVDRGGRCSGLDKRDLSVILIHYSQRMVQLSSISVLLFVVGGALLVCANEMSESASF